jgi:hypothetical protein
MSSRFLGGLPAHRHTVESAELVSRLTSLVVELAERVERLEARATEPPVRVSEPDRLPK